MADQDLFALFDPDEDAEISHRNLPHWQQAGKTYFVTFRTHDSLPQAVIAGWYQKRNAWLKRYGIAPETPSWHAALARLPAQARREFHQTSSEQFHQLLDNCHGKCVLRRPPLARIVADSLLH